MLKDLQPVVHPALIRIRHGQHHHSTQPQFLNN